MGYFQETLQLDTSEVLVSMFRGHALRVITRLIGPLLFLFVLFLFLFPLFRMGFAGVLFFLFALLLDSLFIFRLLIIWYGTFYTLTNRRLLSIRRKGFFKKQTQEILLENISELSSDTHGALHSLFQCGDVKLTLYTASHMFTLHDVPSPQDTLTRISQQIAFAKKHIQGDEEATELVTSEENLKKGKVQAPMFKKNH